MNIATFSLLATIYVVIWIIATSYSLHCDCNLLLVKGPATFVVIHYKYCCKNRSLIWFLFRNCFSLLATDFLKVLYLFSS